MAEEKIAAAHAEGYRVCVVDAAVMLNAGWQRNMHEIWVTIAPDTEVNIYRHLDSIKIPCVIAVCKHVGVQ